MLTTVHKRFPTPQLQLLLTGGQLLPVTRWPLAMLSQSCPTRQLRPYMPGFPPARHYHQWSRRAALPPQPRASARGTWPAPSPSWSPEPPAASPAGAGWPPLLTQSRPTHQWQPSVHNIWPPLLTQSCPTPQWQPSVLGIWPGPGPNWLPHPPAASPAGAGRPPAHAPAPSSHAHAA